MYLDTAVVNHIQDIASSFPDKDYCSALKTLAQLIGQYIQPSNSL